MIAQSWLIPSGSTAVFSPDGVYRYLLHRELGRGRGTCLFVMLNPSTADESSNDPTVRACIGFARLWGHASLEVVNLFAFRSTDPAGLKTTTHPVGSDNDECIQRAARSALRIVVAWGNHHAVVPGRSDTVGRLIQNASSLPVECLGVNADGSPKHPLYLARAAQPVPYEDERAFRRIEDRGGRNTDGKPHDYLTHLVSRSDSAELARLASRFPRSVAAARAGGGS